MEWTTLASLGLVSVAAAFDQSGDPFPIGYWYGPPVEQTTPERYAEIAAAHFNLALPQGTGPHLPQQNLAMLEAAATHGIRCIVADDRLTPRILKQPDGLSVLEKVVQDYRDHPAFWGYFICDEPHAREFEALADLLDALAQKDPEHPAFINLFPNYATPAQLGASTYEEYVEKYIQVVQPEFLSYDHYHFLKDGDRPGFIENLDLIREKAEKYDVPFWLIVLCVTHGPYRDLTEAEIRWEVFHGLAYGAQGILYFTYWTPPPDPKWNWRKALISWEGERTERYAQVQRINAELATLGPTLMRLQSTGVYHSGKIPEAGEPLPEENTIYRAQGGDMTLGFFEDDEENEWLLVINRNYRKAIRARLSVIGSVDRVVEMDKLTGRFRTLPIGTTGDESVVEVELNPGDGRLIQFHTLSRGDDDRIPSRRATLR